MGVQSGINRLIGAAGSAAAAATLVKGAKEHEMEQALRVKSAKEHDMEQAFLGKEQAHEADAAIKELQGQSEAKKNEWGEAEGDLAILEAKRPGGKGNTKAALDEKRKAKMSEIEAAQRAFDELQDRIEAKKAMKSRAEIMMQKANK